jgi:hypothetical protein
MRRLIIKWAIVFLEKYLNLPVIEDGSKIQDFMENTWAHQGFRDYVTKRNNELIYEAAGGSGMQALDRTKYIELVGRRLEILYFATLAKKSFALKDQQKRGKTGIDSINT